MKRFASIVFLVCLVVCIFSGTGLFTPHGQSKSSDEYAYEEKLRVLVRLLDTYYVDGYDLDALEDILASAAVAATGDRWSYYVSAADSERHMQDTQNEYVGIGVTIRLEKEDDPGVTVLEVNKGGPAHTAGILPGDMIVAVDGQYTTDVDTLTALIKGEEGTSLTITVLRDGETLDLGVVRSLVELEIVTYRNMDGIGYIKIDNFQNHCAQRTIEAIDTLMEENVEGLIFDLRYNPGGRKADLCEILDYILPEGPLFRSFAYDGSEFVDYSFGESVIDLPMVVMVNQDSYSAAEFFAAAMQEYGWATIVGSQTVGKGNYQQTFMLSDGSAVAISTGHYSTPNGVNLEGVGVTPDVTVDVDEDTYMKIYLESISEENDPQLQAALEQFAK